MPRQTNQRDRTVAGPSRSSRRKNMSRSTVTVKMPILPEHSAWKWFNRGHWDLYVSLKSNQTTLCQHMLTLFFFSGDGRWRQVIRRCASVAEYGNTEVCNWGVYKNGVYWEECYCSQDGCNSSNNIKPNALIFLLKAVVSLYAIMYVVV